MGGLKKYKGKDISYPRSYSPSGLKDKRKMTACNARRNFIPEATGASAIDKGATIAAVTAEAISTDAAATQKASVPAAGSS